MIHKKIYDIVLKNHSESAWNC